MRFLTVWLITLTTTCAVVAFFPVQQRSTDLVQPADMILLAWNDAKKLPPEIATYTRYLDLSFYTVEQRETAYKVIAGHCQHLSSSADIVPPKIIPGSVGALLRINTLDYGESFARAWEQLADADPYYHVQAVEIYHWPPAGHSYQSRWSGGRREYLASDGYWYPAQESNRTVTAFAPWLTTTEQHKTALAGLAAHCQTQVPIVKGEWWFNMTGQQRVKPGYYDFLGVRTKADFERKVVGFDAKTFASFAVESRAAVGQSGVAASDVRAVVAIPRHGYSYTIDFATPKDGNHPLNTIGRDLDATKFDAHEGIGVRANGFPATYASDAKGVFQDVVPANIAADRRSASNRLEINCHSACIRCHTKSVQHVDRWFAGVQFFYNPYSGEKFDVKKQVEIRQQYNQDINKVISVRARYFDEAVQLLGFKDSAEYSKAYSESFFAIEDARVDLIYVSRSMGIELKRVRHAFTEAKKYGRLDPMLDGLLRGRTLRRLDWEAKYSTAWGYVTSYPLKGE